MKKGGLGKGLSALIPDSGVSEIPEVTSPDPVSDPSAGGTVAGEARLATIAVADVSPNQYQPRRIFDDEKMAELTLSIQEVGVLQPILVRQTDGGYELVAGERR